MFCGHYKCKCGYYNDTGFSLCPNCNEWKSGTKKPIFEASEKFIPKDNKDNK